MVVQRRCSAGSHESTTPTPRCGRTKQAASPQTRIIIHRNGHSLTRGAIRCLEVPATHGYRHSITFSIMGTRDKPHDSMSSPIFLAERKFASNEEQEIPTAFGWVTRQ